MLCVLTRATTKSTDRGKRKLCNSTDVPTTITDCTYGVMVCIHNKSYQNIYILMCTIQIYVLFPEMYENN